MQQFFPHRRLKRLIVALCILVVVATLGFLPLSSRDLSGIGGLALMGIFVLALLLFYVSRVELGEDELRISYPFKLFNRRYRYRFVEIEEVQMSVTGSTPSIRVVFQEDYRRETMYSEGRTQDHSHLFSRVQLLQIAEAMRNAGMAADIVFGAL